MLSEAERDGLSDILFNIDLASHPDIPWRKVSGSGNIYRHDYEDVVHRLVWGTVHEFLPALRVVVETEIAADG